MEIVVAKEYGINYCRRVISDLQKLEDKLFETTGFGFTMNCQEHRTLNEYQALLKKFKKEKELGFSPSYKPSIHGAFIE